MSTRSCNSPTSTGEEAARTNANIESGQMGNRGTSSRRARCLKSGRRASKFRRTNEEWAAKIKTNNKKLKHEEIKSMMGRRLFDRKKARVTEEDVQRWVEEQEQHKRQQVEMYMLQTQMETSTERQSYPTLGSVPSVRPEGVFRGLLVQLNSMVTTTVKNRKARELEYVVKKYEVRFIGVGEIGVNWAVARRKRLL